MVAAIASDGNCGPDRFLHSYVSRRNRPASVMSVLWCALLLGGLLLLFNNITYLKVRELREVRQG